MTRRNSTEAADAPMPAPTWKPAVKAPGAPHQKHDATGDEKREAPAHPKMAGQSGEAGDTSRSPVANRDPAGPRKAGTTPRPTDEPID